MGTEAKGGMRGAVTADNEPVGIGEPPWITVRGPDYQVDRLSWLDDLAADSTGLAAERAMSRWTRLYVPH